MPVFESSAYSIHPSIHIPATMSKFSLLKYSRSYPPDDPGHVACKPTSSDAVWQHFAFPELYLTFSKNDRGELQTALLKILWTKDIILVCFSILSSLHGVIIYAKEEMDLLSFKSRSSSASFLPSQASQSQSTGSSLRVVYRDSVVGFRYTKTPQKTSTGQTTVRALRAINSRSNAYHCKRRNTVVFKLALLILPRLLNS